MARRYHQSKMDRMDERKGMMRRDSGETEGMKKYGGGMIHDDMSAPDLLPRHVIDQYWSKAPEYNRGYVEDLYKGVQNQMHEDERDMRKIAKAGKY